MSIGNPLSNVNVEVPEQFWGDRGTTVVPNLQSAAITGSGQLWKSPGLEVGAGELLPLFSTLREDT